MFDLTVQCECHCNISQDASNLKHRKTEIVTFSSSRWTIVVLPDNLLSMMSNRDPTDKPEKAPTALKSFAVKYVFYFCHNPNTFDIKMFSVQHVITEPHSVIFGQCLLSLRVRTRVNYLYKSASGCWHSTTACRASSRDTDWHTAVSATE